MADKIHGAVRRIVGRKIGVDAAKKRGSPCMENCPSGIVSAQRTKKGSAEFRGEEPRGSDRERDRDKEGASETENGAGAREMESKGREQDGEWNSRSNKQRT